MISTFFSGLDAMVEELKLHPYIVVKRFTKNPPAPGQVLAQAAEQIPWFRDSELEAFYKTHNGVYLYWTFDDQHPPEEMEGLFSNYCEGYEIFQPEDEDSWQTFAKINFLSLEEVLNNSWNDQIICDKIPAHLRSVSRGEIVTPQELKNGFFAFDSPGADYFASFCGISKDNQPLVILPDLSTTAWQSARILDLQSYFSLLLETRGMVEARIKAFYSDEFLNTNGILKAEQKTFSSLRPKLFDNWWKPRK